MDRKVLLILALGLIISLNKLYIENEHQKITTKSERDEYEAFINNHEFSRNRYTSEQLSAIPKKDRPDLAWEQNYLLTMNPETKRPEREKLFPVLEQTKLMQKNLAGLPGAASTPWIERGPNNVGGRTRALTWDPTSTNKVWAGSVTGGLWFNNDITDANSQWIAVNDFWDNISVTKIAFDPNDSDIIYVGTGEGWGTNSSRGAGVWKSTDGGANFSQLASTVSFFYINDLVIKDAGATSEIYLAVASHKYEGVFHGPSQEGLRRSIDGGTTWTQVLPDGPNGHPEKPTDIDIAADGEIWVGVDLSIFSGADRGGGKIYSSTDGVTFTLRHTHSSAGRVNIACAPSDANYIYAAFEVGNEMSAFKQSTNDGTTWTTKSEPNDADTGIDATDFTRGQAWYDLTLAVDPNDEDVLMIGGIDLFRTDDGGTSWTQTTHWYGGFGFQEVHADQQTIVYKDGSSSVILFGNDGGVFYTDNGNTTTPTLGARNKGYNVTQFYAGAMHPSAGNNLFLAGSQDNGTQKFTTSGVNSTTEVVGGDGAYCHIDQTDATFQTASFTFNSIYHSSDGGGTFSNILNDQATGSFINRTDLDYNQNILYTYRTSSSLYRITNYESASPTTGTLNISDIGSAATHLSVSPYTTGSTTLFLGSSAGKVFKIENADGTPSSSEITGASFPTGSVSCIAFGQNEDEIVVTFSNYGVTSVWYTSNGGTSWVSKEGDLPDMPVRWAIFNPINNAEVLLATEVGVWGTADISVASPSWTATNSGLANVRVDMLQVRTSDNEVMASTFGRGVFSSSGFNGVCAPPTSLIANNTTATASDLSWTAGSSGESEWDLEYGLSGFTLGTGVQHSGLTNNSLALTGLSASTNYEYYVRANCSVSEQSSYAGPFAFTTLFAPPVCGGKFVDTGDISADYSNDEEITTTITPDNLGEAVTLTFTFVDIEAAGSDSGVHQDGCYDYLTIYNGPDTSAPVLAQTLCGQDNGGVPYIGSSTLGIGDSFTSTHISGALTIVFKSDFSVNMGGWEANITCPSSAIVWSGSVSNDWTNTANWISNTVPLASNYVTIPDETNDPVIASDVTVQAIDIETGAALSLNTNSLTVNGEIVLDGTMNVASGASLIPLGTISGTGAATINRNTTFGIADGQYSVIGSPITAGNTSSLGGIIYSYDETIAYDPGVTNGSNRFIQVMTPEVMPVGDAYFSANTGNISFTGIPNSGNVDIGLVYDTGNDGLTDAGFNLISNPYTAAISYDNLMAGNSDIDGTIYLWDDGGSNTGQRTNADYITATSMGSAGSGSGRASDWDGHMRSSQGFFVKASQTPATLHFTPSMMVTGNNSDAGFFRKEEATVMRFSLSAPKVYSDILIGFSENATNGFDRTLDAYKAKGNDVLQLYSKMEENIMAIQALPNLSEEVTVTLGFDVSESGRYVFELQNPSLYGFGIYLKDHKLDRMIDLSEKNNYTFETTSISNSNRFSLVFSPAKILSTNIEPEKNEMILFTDKNQLNIKLDQQLTNATVKVYNLNGRIVKQIENVDFVDNYWSTTFTESGLFIAVVQSKDTSLIKKFISK